MLDRASTLEILRDGEIDVVGRILGSSNNALLVTVTLPCPDPGEPPRVLEAIHKPRIGERPLDDFPDGTLSRREVAAYLVSEASGWDVVPPTVLRDGPFGEGMLQQWIDVDPEADVIEMVNGDDARLRRVATFDAVVNNTDRKAGHLLPIVGGHLHAVDHGVTFSVVPKLRTVLWAWQDAPFAADELAGLTRVRDALGAADAPGALAVALAELLSAREIEATRARVGELLASGTFPGPSPEWPAIPWPPY